MANKQFADYINERTIELTGNRLTDYLVIRKLDGTVKRISISKLLSSPISGDEVHTGGAGTVDVSAVSDGTIIPITGVDYIDNITIADGDVFWLQFQDSGGSLINGTNLIVPGKGMVWSAGDMVEVVGTATGAFIRQIVKASAGPSRPSIFHCQAVSNANVTIATGLNPGDILAGVTLTNGRSVLLAHQTTASENGVYVVGAVPARDKLFDTYDSMIDVMFIIDEVATNNDYPQIWVSSSIPGGMINTTDIHFEFLTSRLRVLNTDPIYAIFAWFGARFKAASSIYNMVLNVGGPYTAERQLLLQLNDGGRELNMSGNLTVPATASVLGTNTGDEIIGALVKTDTDSPVALTAAQFGLVCLNTEAAGTVIWDLPSSADCVRFKTKFTFMASTNSSITVRPFTNDDDIVDQLISWVPETLDGALVTHGSPISSHGNLAETMSVLYIGEGVWITTSIAGRWSV